MFNWLKKRLPFMEQPSRPWPILIKNPYHRHITQENYKNNYLTNPQFVSRDSYSFNRSVRYLEVGRLGKWSIICDLNEWPILKKVKK